MGVKRALSEKASVKTKPKRARVDENDKNGVDSKKPKTVKKTTALYKSGQNVISSGLCLATFLNGASCDAKRVSEFVPYCKKHMDQGDPSMKIVQHPKFGRMLVAARDLPVRYHMGLYGARKTKSQMTEENLNWAFETPNCGYIDPDGYEAQVKYCQCPGPNERVTVGFSGIPELISKKSDMGSMMFCTKMAIPKNYQLCMMYSDSIKATDVFFAERGITRADVGTPQYPCFRKNVNLPEKVVASKSGVEYPRYGSGQHTVKSGRCIATFLNGEPCTEVACENFVPYCKKHMSGGDPSLKVTKHPKYGKCLIAARELPAKYYMALYGELMPKKACDKEDLEWCFITDGKGTINPNKHNAQLMYCQCPGPDEIVTVAFAPGEYEYCEKKAKLGSMLFVTKRTIPKNNQLVMMYAEDEKSTAFFFKERGIIRDNVGCPQYPCFRKQRSQMSLK